MDRRVTPPKRVTSPTWSPPPPCKQALSLSWACLRSDWFPIPYWEVMNNNSSGMNIILLTITYVKPSVHQTGNCLFKNNPSAFGERLSSKEACVIYELLIHVYDVDHIWHLSHSSFVYRIQLTPTPRTTASRFQSTTVQTETRLSRVLICRVAATRADGPSVARLSSWRASNLIVLFSRCPIIQFFMSHLQYLCVNHLTCVYYLRGKRIKEIAFCAQTWCMMYDFICSNEGLALQTSLSESPSRWKISFIEWTNFICI